MTGSPLDGIPWWAKVVVYTIYAPVVAYDKVVEIAKKFKPTKRGKK